MVIPLSKGLVANYGGVGGGGMYSFTPTKRGVRTSFSHAEGGGAQQFLG